MTIKYPTGRVPLWAVLLQPFDIAIEYTLSKPPWMKRAPRQPIMVL